MRVPYIYGKRLKAYYLQFAAVFRLRCMFVLSFVFWYVCRCLFLFPLSLAFCFTKIVCETLCKFLYVYASLKCIFIQNIMINRKFVGISSFQHICRNVLSFYFLPLCFFLLFWIIYRKQKQKRKKPHFCRFCPKTSVFVANKVLIFSDLYLYRANCTPHPRFWHSQGGSALVRKFFIFLFFIFCKIL